MNGSAWVSLYRSLVRHKLYATLNIGGLALGIAVFCVLALYVRFETSFETWLPHHDEIYLVQTELHLPGSPLNGAYPGTMAGMLEQMRQDFPGSSARAFVAARMAARSYATARLSVPMSRKSILPFWTSSPCRSSRGAAATRCPTRPPRWSAAVRHSGCSAMATRSARR